MIRAIAQCNGYLTHYLQNNSHFHRQPIVMIDSATTQDKYVIIYTILKRISPNKKLQKRQVILAATVS